MEMFTYLICVISYGILGLLAQPSEPITTLRPEDERTCVPGFVCKHGHCVQSNFLECVCDPGFVGAFCEKYCPIDCGPYGRCMIYKEQPTCVCDWRYTGTFCDTLRFKTETPSTDPVTNVTDVPTTLPQNITTTIHPTTSTTTPVPSKTDQGQLSTSETTSLPLTSDKQTSAAQSLVTEAPITTVLTSSSTSSQSTTTPTTSPQSTASTTLTGQSTASPTTTGKSTASPTEPSVSTGTSTPTTTTNETECFPGFICQHGHCPDGRLICICDEGWVGPFCEWNCNLTCGDNGHCNSYSSGDSFCICKPGYTGDNCEILEATIPEAATPTTISNAPSTVSQTPTTVSQTTTTESPAPTAVSQTPTTVSQTTTPVSLAPTTVSQTPTTLSQTTRPVSPAPTTVSQTPTTESQVLGTTSSISPSTSQSVETRNQKQCKAGFTCVNGVCNKTDTQPSCICDPGYLGLFCEKKLQSDLNELRGDQGQPEWYWYMLGSCIVLLVLLLVLLVVIPYCMWKRRDIFFMKIIYMFQPYEDDDNKLFDAFISYKSTAKDEDFVLRQLFPRLETDNNFKLCLHFRDFIPGETISNNITWAVENSRRTILILTPDYIRSEFCRFEYQRAQHEMLKRKQRIIPVILEDVSKQMNFMDSAMQSIVKSVSYLTWPGEENEDSVNKFFKRLELSLPKKRRERNLCKKRGQSKPDNVRLRRFSKDNRPSNTNDSDFVRLSIDDENILNGFRNSRDTNSMTMLM